MNESEIDNSKYTVSLELPSKFLPYNFNELWIRPYKIGEVKKIRATLSNEAKSHEITEIISDCMSINPKELTLGDFWYVLAWLRLNSFENTPLTVTWNCSSCSVEQDKIINLSELKIVELPDEYKEPATVTLPNGKKIPLGMYREGYEHDVKNYCKNLLGKADYPQTEEIVPDMAITILNDNTLSQNVKWLNDPEEFTPDDLRYIEAFQNEFSHGLPKIITAECKECEYVNKHIRLAFLIYNIIPINRSPADFRNAVEFG